MTALPPMAITRVNSRSLSNRQPSREDRSTRFTDVTKASQLAAQAQANGHGGEQTACLSVETRDAVT